MKTLLVMLVLHCSQIQMALLHVVLLLEKMRHQEPLKLALEMEKLGFPQKMVKLLACLMLVSYLLLAMLVERMLQVKMRLQPRLSWLVVRFELNQKEIESRPLMDSEPEFCQWFP